MSDIDVDWLTMAITVVGLGVVVLMNRQTVPVPQVPDPTGEAMEVDEAQLKPTKDKGKEYQLGLEGDLKAKATQIYNYVCSVVETSFQIQRYFENALVSENKNINWMEREHPKEFETFQTAMAWLSSRASELMGLQSQLVSMGATGLAASMQNMFNTPTQVYNRLLQYNYLSPDDVEQYDEERVRAMLADVVKATGYGLGLISQQVDNYAALTAEAMQRLDNKLDDVIMQDADGHLLMRDPTSAGMVYLEQTRRITHYDKDGNPQVMERREYMNMPQNQFPPGPQEPIGWQNTGYLQQSDYTDPYERTNQYPSDPYQTINPKEIDLTVSDVQDQFKVVKNPGGGVNLKKGTEYQNPEVVSAELVGKQSYSTAEAKPVGIEEIPNAPVVYHKAPPRKVKEPFRVEDKDEADDRFFQEIDTTVNDPPDNAVVETQYDEIAVDAQGNTNIFGDIRNANPYGAVQQEIVPKKGIKRGRSASMAAPDRSQAIVVQAKMGVPEEEQFLPGPKGKQVKVETAPANP